MKDLTELLNVRHQTTVFSCGKDNLDNYIKNRAIKEVKTQRTACFVALKENSQKIKSFYTLSNANLPLDAVPITIRRKLPKSFRAVSVVLLKRLAVDQQDQKEGLGKMMLLEALKRSSETSKTIGSFAVVVHPKNKEAENFFSQYGFIKLWGSSKMFIAMKTIRQLFVA